MYCHRCQQEISDDAQYCAACGAAQQPASAPPGARRLTRSLGDAKIAGVCAGLADYLDVDVTLIRLVWVVLSIVPGMILGGVLAYLLAWLVMPESPTSAVRVETGRRLFRSMADRKVGGVCGGLAEYFGVDATPLRVLWVILSILPGAIAGGLIVYLLAWLVIPNAPATTWHSNPNPADGA
jgi:phage shock protein PspC (stress-responsive transcriptional regulator)